jgi:chromosome segregation protein
LLSKLTFFKELIEQKEGYPDGAKTILDNHKQYDGLIGAVGDLFQIDDKFESAFQSAIGSFAQCLISKDKKSAIKILNAARSQKLGDFSILPLKEFVSVKVDLPSVPKIDGVLGPAIDFCSLPKSAKGLDEGLIGKLLIVEDINKIFDNNLIQKTMS